MKELVVISGKGGTGKTSLVASFAALAESKVIADCDVDAANLHLVLDPTIRHREAFSGSQEAVIRPDACTACGRCAELCRFGAVHANGAYRIDPLACEGCGVCARFCPEGAIDLHPAVSGEWFASETRHGPLVHARLKPGGENSGKLVTRVRTTACEIAERQGLELVLVDGAPGIGCPVVASITGADLVLIVTEPTVSGLHDLRRVHELTRHFGIPALVCVNKADISEAVSDEIEAYAASLGTPVVGRIPYDTRFTNAQLDALSIVEYDASAAEGVRRVWEQVLGALAGHAQRLDGR